MPTTACPPARALPPFALPAGAGLLRLVARTGVLLGLGASLVGVIVGLG